MGGTPISGSVIIAPDSTSAHVAIEIDSNGLIANTFDYSSRYGASGAFNSSDLWAFDGTGAGEAIRFDLSGTSHVALPVHPWLARGLVP